MNEITLENRVITDINVIGNDIDAFVEFARWDDTGEPLSEPELERLNYAFSDLVHTWAHDYQN